MKAGAVLDLVVLVPGRDERETLDGLLTSRRPSLGIRHIDYAFATAPMRDSGCYQTAHRILQPFCERTSRALVLFDHFGSGQQDREVTLLEQELRGRLAIHGWDDRAEVIVLEPELEAWVWSGSPVVDEILGWGDRQPPLREWLRAQGAWPDGCDKPRSPKASMAAALREARIPRSPRLYKRLAERVSLVECGDRAFQRLVRFLQTSFPAE